MNRKGVSNMPPEEIAPFALFKVGDSVTPNLELVKARPSALPRELLAPGQAIRVVEVRPRIENGAARPKDASAPHPQEVAVSAGGMEIGSRGFMEFRRTFFSGSWFVPVSH
jgi:hypothetical protein